MSSALSFSLILGVVLSSSSLLLHHKNLKFLILRQETIHVFVFIFCSYVYVKFILKRIRSRIRGENLEAFSLQFHLRFDLPEFVDKGFSDLTRIDEFWKMKHKVFSYCASQAFRSYMEDRMHYMYDPNMSLSIFGIFDGHGGMWVSDYLEAHFAASIRERLSRVGRRRKLSCESIIDEQSPSVEAIVTEVHRLDDAISRLDPVFTSMTGSTLIAAILEENRYLTVVNVGDSRAIACDRFNQAVPLSTDHKPGDQAERRRVQGAGGFIKRDGSTHRIQGILAVSRAFGDTDLKKLGVLTAHPDVLRIDLVEKPLKFLIVGTDGFWDVISNQEAVKYALEYLKSHGVKDWHRISTYLVKIALERRTHDNVSVLFIKLIIR